MELDRNLVKQFASVMASASEQKSEGKRYGTVSRIDNDNEITYVELDGSGIETPVQGSVVSAVGDRVIVQTRDHKAYISDNFTAPPNGRAGDKYYYFDNNRGMIIGRLDPETHEPEGNYVLITDTDYRICNEDDDVLAVFGDTETVIGDTSAKHIRIDSTDGYEILDGSDILAVFSDTETVIGKSDEKHIRVTDTDGYEIYDGLDLLASFDDNEVLLGNNSSNARIYFCDSKGVIYYTDNTLVLQGDKTTGMSSARSDYRTAQTAVTASPTRLAAAISLLKPDSSVGAQVALEYDDVNDKYNVDIRGNSVSSNGNAVLTAADKLIVFGTVQIRGNVVYNKSRTFTVDIGPTGYDYIPAGYTLAGLRQVSTNHATAIKLTQFGTLQSTNEIYATLFNASRRGDDYVVTVTLKWFAIKSGSAGSGSSTIDPIILPDYGGDDEPAN